MATQSLENRRLARLRTYTIDQATAQLESEHPGFKPESIVASICAYEEEGNIGGVLDKMPALINGELYTTLVVVDGGDDKTAAIARSYPGVIVIEFPVNLGHGVALQVTYRYCIDHHVKYIVTLDADGQNDPAEIPQVLRRCSATGPTSSLRAAVLVSTGPRTVFERPACASSRSS